MDEHEMCQNCKRDIPISNYKMHTLHCSRNIIKCDICDEPLNSSEMETHRKLVHSKKPCTECGMVMAVIQLEEHREKECPKRNIICSFCEIDIKAEEQESHEGYCGSRTEKCPECGDFVMLKDWVKHSEMRLYHELANKPCAEVFGHNDTGGGAPWTPSVQPPRGASMDYSWSPSILAGPSQLAFSTYTTNTSSIPEDSSTSSTRQSSSSRHDSSIPDLEVVSSRKSSISGYGRVPISTSPSAVGSPTEQDPHYQSPTGFDFSIPSEETKEEDPILIPCEFCSLGIDMYKLILHQTKCDRNPDSVSILQRTSSLTPSLLGGSSLITVPKVENDLRTTTSSSSGPIVSDTICPSLSEVTSKATRRSSLRKDSIVEKYLTKPPSETLSEGYSGGARAKTSLKPLLGGSSDDEEGRTRKGRVETRMIPRRKASAPMMPPLGPATKGLTSPKSTPNLQDLVSQNGLRYKGSSSSASKLNEYEVPQMTRRKSSNVSNGNGERDDREGLRQLLENYRKDPFDDDLENNDGSFFPCEFCGDPYPVEYLMRHQLSCDLNPMPVSSGDGFNYDIIRNRIESNMNIE